MITLEELNTKINQIKSSTEITETLLAEILDQLKVIEKNHPQQSNDLQLEALNKIHEQITQIKKQNDSRENAEVLSGIENLKTHFEKLIKQKNINQVTIFGGNNAALNYQRLLIGCGVLLFCFIGFRYLSEYFIQKQQQDENFLLLKTYAETEKMAEFINTGNTIEYDKIILAIADNDETFNNYFQKLKNHWDKEHEKVVLEQQIEQNQQRLKELSK